MAHRLGVAAGAGSYVAGTVALPALLLAAWLGRSPAGAVVPLALAVGLLVTGLLAAWLADRSSRRLEPARRAGVALRLLAIPVVGGLAVTVAGFAWPATPVASALLAAAVAVAGLLLLRSAAATHHARLLVTGSDSRRTSAAPERHPLPEVVDRWPVRRQRLANGLLAVATLALAVPSFLQGSAWWPLHAAIGAGFVLAALAADRSLAITDAGLLVESRFAARLFEWDEFAGYYRGEHLVLLRRGWWRGDLVFDRDAVADEAIARLDAFLREREHRAVPAGDRQRRGDRTAAER